MSSDTPERKPEVNWVTRNRYDGYCLEPITNGRPAGGTHPLTKEEAMKQYELCEVARPLLNAPPTAPLPSAGENATPARKTVEEIQAQTLITLSSAVNAIGKDLLLIDRRAERLALATERLATAAEIANRLKALELEWEYISKYGPTEQNGKRITERRAAITAILTGADAKGEDA